MSIKVVTDNIFNSNAQTLVNTVNCEGIMGAGLALECRLRYPEMFQRYQQLCQQKLLQPGKLWLYKSNQKWILNFPTKTGWKQPSRWSYLEQGLDNLIASYIKRGITSLALPLLGADKGGLDKDKVLDFMITTLSPIAKSVPIVIYQYHPSLKDDLFESFTQQLTSLTSQQLQQQTGVTQKRIEAIKQAAQSGKYAQINQLAQLPGVGLKTLERIFQYCQQEHQAEPDNLSLF